MNEATRRGVQTPVLENESQVAIFNNFILPSVSSIRNVDLNFKVELPNFVPPYRS